MSLFLHDFRYGIRTLLKNPGFAAAAILSLGIGIGANTAIFSVTNALLLRPLPFADAERLAILWNRSPGLNIAEDWFSTAQYFDIATGQDTFEALAIAIGSNFNLTGDGEPQRVGVIRVSSNLLPMLGVAPVAGQLFTPEDDLPGRPLSAILSHGIWMRRYGGDPEVVGRTISLNSQPVQIVGVLPQSFSLPREVLPTLGVIDASDIFLPLPLAPTAATVRTREDYNILGKLKPGVTVAQAQAQLDVLTARLRRDFPDVYPPNGGLTFSVVPLLEQVVGDVRRPLIVLLGSVGFVLLIACANVANLLLSRALARQKEIAVRAALGASRARVIRQLLTESALLAAAGGAVGVGLALAGVRWIHALQPKNVPRLQTIAVDGDVLIFTVALCALSALLFGLAPALGVFKLDLHGTLKDAGRGSAGANALWGRGNRLRRLLVAFELALSVVLLIGAGLLIRSFAHVQTVNPGFNPENVLTFEITTTGRKYTDPQIVLQTYRDLYERLGRLPGVVGVGGVNTLPLAQFFAWGPITVEGRIPPPGEVFVNADQRVASGRYFETMEIPLIEGRWFHEDDTTKHPRVVLIDELMAREMWPGQSPVGKRLKYGDAASESPWETVVGVVGRVKQYGLDSDSRMAMYRPQTQSVARAIYVTVRVDGDAGALAPVVREEIRAIDPELPVAQMRTMASRVDESLARRRFSMSLLAVFAGLALVLAGIGIYGVMAYLVSQGTREMGIRIALGASSGAILAMVLRQGLIVAAVGVAVGLAGAFALTKLMHSLLFGVRATDPLTFVTIGALLAAIAVVASYIPARRAARVDPLIALRTE